MCLAPGPLVRTKKERAGPREGDLRPGPRPLLEIRLRFGSGLANPRGSPVRFGRTPARQALPPHISYVSDLEVLVADCDGAVMEFLGEAHPVTGRQAV